MSIPINFFQDIIDRCHQRHENPLKQRRTSARPLLYKGLPYHFRVHCAQQYPVPLQDLEAAGISFMPIGPAPGADRPPRSSGRDRFLKRQGATDARPVRWQKSWGIQIYTGVHSARDDAPWHDIGFTYEAICAAPDAVLSCVQALVYAVPNPLLTMSKSGGLRFSCRIPGYLHPNTKQAKLYVYKGDLTAPHRYDAYLEIVGEKGYNRWDARYEILLGNLLEPPMISKELLFAPIDILRAKLHQPASESVQDQEDIPEAPYSLGSGKLDLAKEAFFKHGFSYVKQEDGFHYWRRQEAEISGTEVSLWEREGGVWICASTADTGLPTEATLITDVWENTGILPPLPATGLPISDKVPSIRAGNLSPLGIRRPRPALEKPTPTETIHETDEEISTQVQRAFDRNVRVLGIIPHTGLEKDDEVASVLGDGEMMCLNISDAEIGAAVKPFLEKRNVESVTRWRDRMYLWNQVKDTPVDVRMATPFQHGNVCEDPERCEALEKKGGNPDEIICPHCPVYTTCQERGYLSQLATLQTTKAQILRDRRLFLDPQYAKTVEHLLKADDGTQRLCIVNSKKENQLFLEYKLSKTTLEEWIANWRGSALGNFAIAALNALEIKDKSHAIWVERLRTVTQTFEWLEAEIIQQMCHFEVDGRVVERGTIDPETEEELARFTIEFEGGISAYIPLDAAAAERLAAEGLPFFRLDAFVPNADTKILMSIADAVRLGILDASTVENIQAFPTVCGNPHWTFWHQLQYFFSYYTRNADAPMHWADEVLQFWVPPVLHPSVRHLLVTSSALYDRHLHRAFLDEEVEVLPAPPVAWVPGNRVFQGRSSIYPQKVILELDDTWDFLGISEKGQRIFLNIQAEIERDPNIKHGILTYTHAIEQVKDIATNENLCFLANFRKTKGLETAFQEAHVIWIVGLPEMRSRAILNRSRILFGRDEKPLSYEMDPDTYCYKDERVQSTYERVIARIFTEIIELAQLNRLANKKIMLVTGLRIPELTDRPETLLFDVEDLEVAGELDKLPEAIAVREGFEVERDKLTAESPRKEVERILGCSPRHANRVLQRMRGGKLIRIPFREQILAILADGEKTTPEITDAIKGHPKAVNTELTRLVALGEIVKIRRGLYRL